MQADPQLRPQQQEDEGIQSYNPHARDPFVFICKNGPTCKNHDWILGSPLHMIKQPKKRYCEQPAPKKHATKQVFDLML